jgi:hypothetical protein
LAPDFDFGVQVQLWSKMMFYIIIEANIHLRLLSTSVLDIQQVFEPLACCLKGIWVHLYTATLAKVAPVWKFRGSVVE